LAEIRLAGIVATIGRKVNRRGFFGLLGAPFALGLVPLFRLLGGGNKQKPPFSGKRTRTGVVTDEYQKSAWTAADDCTVRFECNYEDTTSNTISMTGTFADVSEMKMLS